MRPSPRTAALLAAAALFTLPAPIAAADQSALATINLLQADGYTVNIDRVGSAPLDQCVVTSVRNPQTVTSLIGVNRRGRRNHDAFDLVQVVVSRSISVSLDCTSR